MFVAGVNNTEIPDTNAKMDNIQIESKPEFMHQYLWCVLTPRVIVLLVFMCLTVMTCRPTRVFRGNQKPAYPIQKQYKPGFSSYQVGASPFRVSKHI